MAQIMPKTQLIPRPAAKMPRWFSFLYYFSVILAIVSISGYFILNQSLKDSRTKLEYLETLIREGKTPERIATEREVIKWERKIEDFTVLLNSHLNPSNFFEVFENFSHPRMEFTSFNLWPQRGRLTVSGQTNDFRNLGQQLLIFKKESLFKEVNLNKVYIGEKGEIRFTFDISLDPRIFTPLVQ